ncbi:MAG: 6-phosphogluconolactonase [Burkholderiales bacterium]
MPQIVRWHVYPNLGDLAARAAHAIARIANEAIAPRKRFNIVLAGGTTPRSVYEKLRGAHTDFQKWHIWFGDERCLPLGHHDRNDTVARATLLDHAAIPEHQIAPIPAEHGPEEAAREYAKLIAGIVQFDLVLLGLGEDGHTASLFPGHDWGTDSSRPAVLPIRGAPKPPPERVSLSAWRLSCARQVLFIVSGVVKRDAINAWRSKKPIPAWAITPDSGVDVFLTEDALF